MSETKSEPSRPRFFRWLIPLGIFLIILLVGGLYVGGKYILMPLTVISFQKKDCAAVERDVNLLARLYPGVLDTYPSQMNAFNECSVYTQALEKQQGKDWDKAHTIFLVYAQRYPDGLFRSEASEQDALVLIEWAKEQIAQKQYEPALKNLGFILSTYPDLPCVSQVNSLMPTAILAWGQDLRAMDDFKTAEAKFKELDTWARANVSQEYVTTSKRELVQTYLEAGQALLAKGDYAPAIERFNQVIGADPDPQAADSATKKAGAALRDLQFAWGNSLAGQEKYTEAMDHYQTYVSLSETDAKPAAKDLVAGIYLKLAEKARKAGDFSGALQQIKLAGDNAGTDTFKTGLETARTETFAAFASSEGGQAEQALRDVGKLVCEKNKAYQYPIFGIDATQKLFGSYGIESPLPKEIAAKTPGSMRYIVCVEIQVQVVQKLEIPILYNGMLYYNKSLGIFGQMVREQYNWLITVRRADTAEVVATKTFVGGEPPALPVITRSNAMDILSGGVYQRFRGIDPDMAEISKWLLSLVK
jgi:tetratricopeptide (TPR) repeat protein